VSTGLSVALDPSGVGSFIHEMGHYLHYQNSPAKFWGLTFTSFKGNEPTTNTPWGAYIKANVSTYGANNPREVVAELVLGMAYNRPFSDNLLKLYKAFGGPIPTSMTAKFATL
jgi:hypothetical protein